MYKLLLTIRYLFRKVTPLFALLGVTLCTAMVIIVGSVMGGFLDLVREAGKSVMGDVVMYAGTRGIADYEQIIIRVNALPEADGASPVISTWGLLKLPGDRTEYVQVVGIQPDYASVTDYRDTLFWSAGRIKDELGWDVDADRFDPVRDAIDLTIEDMPPDGEDRAGMVPGIEVSPYNRRDNEGNYHFEPSILATELFLTVLPIAEGGTPQTPDVISFVVVNEFHSGFYATDSRRVFVPFEVAQTMMLMDPAPMLKDPDDPAAGFEGMTPARCTEIHIAAAEGVDSFDLRQAVVGVYDELAETNGNIPPSPFMSILTWQQRQAEYIQAVEHEKGLLTVLFAIISIVAVFMVGVIFYMIVMQKTRDIGILRSIGASRLGVASIFLGYGAAIGAIGAAIGAVVAVLVVRNINAIHAWLGTGFGTALFYALVIDLGAVLGTVVGLIVGSRVRKPNEAPPVDVVIEVVIGAVLGTLVLGPVGLILGIMVGGRMRMRGLVIWLLLAGAAAGAVAAFICLQASPDLGAWLQANFSIVIWDKKVYFFDKIPSRVDPVEATVVALCAIAASVLGAAIPSVIAGRLDPVRALRYE